MEALQAALHPDDAINIKFTSGTTGNPKGATLSHCNILNNGFLTGLAMKLGPADKLCIPVPLYHCFGMVLSVLACVSHGATMVFPGPSFDPEETLKSVEAEGCTALHGVPTMFITELDHPRFSEFDLSTLRTGIMAGAPCPVEVMKRVLSEMHMEDILIAYGQTELSPINNLTLPNDTLERRTETVGRAMPWVEIKVVDEEGRVVPVGAKGEICTRGYSVMQGYWNDEVATKQAIKKGWLHTGDIVEFDEDNYIKITGRKKEIIVNSGGDNIAPTRVEGILAIENEIEQVMVYGDGYPWLSAVIVPSDEIIKSLNNDKKKIKEKISEAIDHANSSLSQIEKIRKFIIADEPFTVDNLQMTPTLKVRRHVVTGIYQERILELYPKK